MVKGHPQFKNPVQPPVAPYTYSPGSGSNVGNDSQTDEPISLEEVVLETPPSSVGRPMGQKAAKEARRKGKKKEDGGEAMVQAVLALSESNKKAIELLQNREDVRRAEHEKMMAFEQAKEDAKVMAMRTNDFSPESKAFYKKLKSDIRRKNDPNADCYRPLFDDSQYDT